MPQIFTLKQLRDRVMPMAKAAAESVVASLKNDLTLAPTSLMLFSEHNDGPDLIDWRERHGIRRCVVAGPGAFGDHKETRSELTSACRRTLRFENATRVRPPLE